mgnify:CR=1 FL=1
MSKIRSCTTNSLFPKSKDSQGQSLCGYCHKLLPPGQRRWCSESCLHEAYVRCRPSYARELVMARDLGVCAICGFDAGSLDKKVLRDKHREEFRRIDALSEPEHSLRRKEHWVRSREEAVALAERRQALGLFGHAWEVDHILPVESGGGLCGLENLRTLCLACHKKRSAEQRRLKVSQGDSGEKTSQAD